MSYEEKLFELIIPELLGELQNGLLLTDEYPPELFVELEIKVRKILEDNPYLAWGLVTQAHNLICEVLGFPKEVNPYATLPIPNDAERIKEIIEGWKD